MSTTRRPTKRRVNVSLSQDILGTADAQAQKNGETRSAYLSRLIREDAVRERWVEAVDHHRRLLGRKA